MKFNIHGSRSGETDAQTIIEEDESPWQVEATSEEEAMALLPELTDGLYGYSTFAVVKVVPPRAKVFETNPPTFSPIKTRRSA